MRQEFDIGRDLDEFAMSVDVKSTRERIRQLLEKLPGFSIVRKPTGVEIEVLQRLNEDNELL